MVKHPRWTVTYNIISPENNKWVGTGWEFFDEETDAAHCYRRHIVLGNSPAMRPYYHKLDAQYLGVVHRVQLTGLKTKENR